jgi:hypothetical protein
MSDCCPIPAELVLRKAWETMDDFGTLDVKALKKALHSEGYPATEVRVNKRIKDLKDAGISLPEMPAPRRIIQRITCTTVPLLKDIAKEERKKAKARSSEELSNVYRFEG